ncbi:hypothetical protein [Bacillus altitudinis]|uniref:hypothetical protein n=1 Tax=Bacillus altitudinis TaxID=293387 RepID=UPI0011AABDD8|nr:hypothetical protein [Bacillus altitudinis]MCY7718480.1 hypothetical protein [Bacillus altitudinis]MDR7670611.1 hypothetical protein [Bacillus altitudinis]
MLRRFLFIFSTLLMAILILFTASKNSPGKNTVSLDEPIPFILSAAMIIFFFIPPLVMSFFDQIVVRMISGIYQCFILMVFIGLMPISFLIPNGGLTFLESILGCVMSLLSIIFTLLSRKNN